MYSDKIEAEKELLARDFGVAKWGTGILVTVPAGALPR
jgi:hypothetical protein